MDDLHLINRIKETGDSEAFAQLANCHSGIYLSMVDKCLSDKFHTQKNDLKADKDYNLYKAVMDYDPSKGMKFPVYLGQTVRWKCLTLSYRGQDKDTVELEPILSTIKEPEYSAPLDKERVEKIFEYAENFPNKTARDVVFTRFNQRSRPLSWEKVAEKLRITPREANRAYQLFVKCAKKDLSTL